MQCTAREGVNKCLGSKVELMSHKTEGYAVENPWLGGDHGFESARGTQSFHTPRQPVDKRFASMFITVIASSLQDLCQ